MLNPFKWFNLQSSTNLNQDAHLLGIIAIFKNEAHALNEWISHYISQGVSFFLLLDNGSTDDWKVASDYPAYVNIIIRSDNKPYNQLGFYNSLLPYARAHCKWLAIIDLDEFLYARNPYQSISDVLMDINDDVSSIKIPWKMFGSSGHILQPDSIRKHFTYRWSFADGSSYRLYSDKIFCKSIIRSESVIKIGTHTSKLKRGLILDPTLSITDNDEQLFINEELLNNAILHCNHYPIQSKSFFFEVKATRGDASSRSLDKVRNSDYFNNYDKNELYDPELAFKIS